MDARRKIDAREPKEDEGSIILSENGEADFTGLNPDAKKHLGDYLREEGWDIPQNWDGSFDGYSKEDKNEIIKKVFTEIVDSKKRKEDGDTKEIGPLDFLANSIKILNEDGEVEDFSLGELLSSDDPDDMVNADLAMINLFSPEGIRDQETGELNQNTSSQAQRMTTDALIYLMAITRDRPRIDTLLDKFSVKNEDDEREVETIEKNADRYDYDGEYVEIIDTTPTDAWEYFIGNKSERVPYAFMTSFYSIAGTLPILVFAVMSGIYSMGIVLLMIFSPIFLLFGVWPGKGYRLFSQWFTLLISAMLKKIVTGFLAVLTTIMMGNIMGLISDFGYWKVLLLILVFSFILIKQRKPITEKLGKVDRDKGGLGEAFAGSSKKFAKGVGQVATTTAQFGYVAGKTLAKGGNFKDSINAGLANTTRRIGDRWMRQGGLRADIAAQLRRAEKANDANWTCAACGYVIPPGGEAYVSHEGPEVYCSNCAKDLGDPAYYSKQKRPTYKKPKHNKKDDEEK